MADELHWDVLEKNDWIMRKRAFSGQSAYYIVHRRDLVSLVFYPRCTTVVGGEVLGHYASVAEAELAANNHNKTRVK